MQSVQRVKGPIKLALIQVNVTGSSPSRREVRERERERERESILPRRDEKTTLERVPCILVRILDNPVCFSGCLSTTHVPVCPGFSLFVRGFVHVEGDGGSAQGARRRRRTEEEEEEEEEEERRGGDGSAVSPPRTRCHQAQLGMSLGHQHVYQAYFLYESVLRRARVCGQPDNPPLVAATFSYRIISFLNFVSCPYDVAAEPAIFSSLFHYGVENSSLSVVRLRFHRPRCSLTAPVRLLPLYAFDAIILWPL